MASAAEVVAPVAVALLGRDDACRAQLRQALVELGAEIVHEGGIEAADCATIVARAPSVVLVNLEAGSEDAVDRLDALFEQPSINVIFNEAETTSQLAGWDLARWARHLAAKVTGAQETMPPPPPGAEVLPSRDLQPTRAGAPPTPAEEVGEVSLAGFAAEAANSEASVPSSLDLASEPGVGAPAADHDSDDDVAIARIERAPLLEAEPAVDDAPVAVAVVRELHGGEAADDDFSLDLGEIEQALSGLGERAPAAATAEPAAPADADVLAGVDALLGDDGGLSFDDAELGFETTAEPTSTATSNLEFDATAIDDAGLDLDFEAGASDFDDTTDDSASFALEIDSDDPLEATDDALGLESELPDVAPGTSLSFSSGDDEELDLSLDADVAALAAQFDARTGDDRPAAADDGFDLSLPAEPAVEAEPAAPSTSAASSALPDLDLDLGALDMPAPAPVDPSTAPTVQLPIPDVSRADPVPAAAPAPAPAPAAGFGELSLAPVDEEAATEASAAAGAPDKPASGYDFSGLSLSLEPLDGETDAVDTAEAPVADMRGAETATAVAARPAVQAAAPVAASVGIPRVIVLGASIGGPDALRSFLAGLPADFPALLLLAQHLDNGFFSRLATQLQKVSQLPVRTADDKGGPARAGQVVVVPSSHRYLFDDEGGIEALPHTAPPRYKPCIDELLCDVAERFGNRVTAIIFSGMAGDAIEGAVRVTARGGEVWAQDPASCVVSSMVDGARARGVVEFIGSPRELAERCVERYGRGA